MSLKEKILGAEDRPFEDVPTPEWEKAGVSTVRIITLSAADGDEWEAAALIARARAEGTDRLRNLRAELVARCAVDPETGERIFNAQEVEALGKKSMKAIRRLFNVAAKLNAVEEGDVKELEKNSVRGRSGVSHTVLPWLSVAAMWMGSFLSLPSNKSKDGAPSKE